MVGSSGTDLFVVVGGGWSGLYALKYLLEEGLHAVLYEREPFIAGIWHYKDKSGGVYRSTHATSSKTFMHASDFPMPEKTCEFPSHEENLNYLKSYCEHFLLWPHIYLEHNVVNISHQNQTSQKWIVRLKNNEREEFEQICDGVVICSGQHQTPSIPNDEIFKNFTGTFSHSFDYKYPLPEYYNKNILIVGGGETASDLAVELSPVAKKVYMSIRNGQWFQDRILGNQPADIMYTMLMRIWSYYDNINVKIYKRCFVVTMWGQGGTGIPEWQPTSNFLHGFINKSREVVHKVAMGLVIPKRAILKIEENLVTFEPVPNHDRNDEESNLNSNSVRIDHILYCTGYRWNFPFFSAELEKEITVERLYKLVFPVGLKKIAFVGTARPVFGSIPALAELQARWVSYVFKGKVTLPTQAKMLRSIHAYWKRHQRLYPHDHIRMKQLVNLFEFADVLGDEMGVRPNVVKLFFRHPFKWFKIYCASPWSPFLFRLGTISSQAEKLAYRRHLECIPKPYQSFHRFNDLFICAWASTIIITVTCVIIFIFVLAFKL
ncbi:unnamed protein product [Didymodactylos carnosus]|uniref:Flavin-containing monooxygenase n=1 Tax=Didymodactylos carnosus TaxID=1234261 RepID=A0A8S2QMQ9_9BILA|nr:unnamed protein product [Didymodactylos carnosus]CAF4122216.1 unnamed protein product [Didymodactylos carnosus]